MKACDTFEEFSACVRIAVPSRQSLPEQSHLSEPLYHDKQSGKEDERVPLDAFQCSVNARAVRRAHLGV